MQTKKLIQATTLFLIKDDRILLGRKKTGLGKGNYLGIGGKVEAGESVAAAAIREAEEEIGITNPKIVKVAEMNFRFPEHPDWSQYVHVFTTRHWEGTPTESKEIKPAWFRFCEIPFNEMWSDDIFWLSAILQGHTLKGDFLFDRDAKIKEVSLKEHVF